MPAAADRISTWLTPLRSPQMRQARPLRGNGVSPQFSLWSAAVCWSRKYSQFGNGGRTGPRCRDGRMRESIRWNQGVSPPPRRPRAAYWKVPQRLAADRAYRGAALCAHQGCLPCRFRIGPGLSGTKARRKSLILISPMKQIPWLSFFPAVARLNSRAALTDFGFAEFTDGKSRGSYLLLLQQSEKIGLVLVLIDALQYIPRAVRLPNPARVMPRCYCTRSRPLLPAPGRRRTSFPGCT